MMRADFDAFHDAATRLLQDPGRLRALLAEGVNGSAPDRGAWRQFAAAGWFRLLLGEAHGGLGLDVQALGAIFLAVGAHPVRGPLLEHAVTLPLLRALAPAQHGARLDAALDGERFLCVAQPQPGTHPAAGSIALAGRSLRGAAELVPFGHWADDVLAAGRMDDGEPVLVLLEAAAVSRSARDSVDPCADYSRIALDAVPVQEDDVVLRGRDASEFLQRCTDLQRLLVAAELSGGAAELVRMSVEYARTRRQFGRAIGSFQALQHLLAEMAARSAALRNLVHATLADACATPARLHELGMVAKAYACTVGRELAQDALQVHGGIGFTTDLPLHLYMRRVFTWQGWLGETDALLAELGADALQQEPQA